MLTLLLALSILSPGHFETTVSIDGQSRTLVLERHSLRGQDFRVRVWRADGGIESVAAPPVATYRGTVTGDPESLVAAHFGPEGLEATILVDHQRWLMRRGQVSPSVSEPFVCPLGAAPASSAPQPTAHQGQHLAEIAFDIDFQYYLLQGSSIPNSVAAVEAIMNQVELFYARDVLITYEITDVLVRTSQFYFPTGGGNLLDLFRIEWNTNQAAIPRDMAHLMTNKSGIEFGGLAYVGATCTSFAYGWSLDSANIVGHELGHNWGSGHCHDVSPCNNMCGGCFFIAPNSKDIMTAYRDSQSCLDEVGPYADPLAPYAHPDGLVLTRDELAMLPPTSFDVLANDHDGNFDPLAIDAFAATTERGGSVTLAAGELVYTPPGFVFPEADRFSYTVGDGTGQDQTGEVTVSVPARRLVGYWPLDEGEGSTAGDAAGEGRAGTLEGGASWVTGLHGKAVRFNGTDAGVSLPPLNLNGNALTITAWIRRTGAQDPFASLVFNRDGNTVAGLNFGNANELRYHWNDAADTWSWNSGLVVPDLQWVFVALVVEPDRATIWMDDGTLQSAVNVVNHDIEQFDGVTKLGYDPGTTVRYFSGVMDDVRLRDHSMNATEIAALAASGGPAVGPNPPDGGRLSADVGELSWIPGLQATAHQVYIGTDYETVRDATTVSPEYFAELTEASVYFDPGTHPDAIYAWRVDEIVGQNVIPGQVWLFSPARTDAHWRLDETTGAVADDSAGANDGAYVGGVVLGEPGAAPASATSITLDGFDDRVEIPPLDVERTALTITGWAKRDGVQEDWAGLVFSRAGAAVAGISVRAGGELRYHWDGAHWDWSSGLTTPDAEWFFFALVVRPTRTVVYLGVGDQLLRSTNWALHAAELFDGTVDLGRDPSGNRDFRGGLDDVRLYDAAFTPRDMETLFERARLASGQVPNDLLVGRVSPTEISLSWSASCLDADADYAVYEGAIGDFSTHLPNVCSTTGSTDATIAPSGDDRYILVVPQAAASEGGYGTTGAGMPRPPSSTPCKPPQPSACND